MSHFVGLDVSQKMTAICVVDKDGRRIWRPTPRAILIEALRHAHRWRDELLSDPCQTLESICFGEGKTVRSIRMTLLLAFLTPEIVKAAVEGRLPRGFGLKRLVDLPMASLRPGLLP